MFLKKSAKLVKEGEKFNSLYIVQHGSLKSYKHGIDGKEQVSGLYLPGDLIGLEALDQSRHFSSVKALEGSSLCEVSYSSLQKLSHQIPSLQQNFLRIMAIEILKIQEQRACLTKKSAESRYATYLIYLSKRNQQLGFSASELVLSMSRTDIASYLNMTIETISRLSTRLQRENIIISDKDHISLIDIEELYKIAGVVIEKVQTAAVAQ